MSFWRHRKFIHLFHQGGVYKKNTAVKPGAFGRNSILGSCNGEIFLCLDMRPGDYAGNIWQDRKKDFQKRYFIPKNIDDVLRYLKYLVLFSVIYITWNTGKLIINAYDPFAAYAHIPAGIGELLDDYLVGFAILILSLILSMFFDRFFCKYTCPLGAFFGILKKLSFYKIKRNEYSCINCSRCSDVCPVNIEVDKVKEIKSSECINCLDCVAACPTKPNSISAHIYKKPLNPHWVFIGGLLIYLGFIGGGRVLGYWKTTPSNVQNIIKSNPENIRGWMTLNLVSEEFGIPLKLLYDKLGLKSGDFPPDIMIKDAEKGLEKKGNRV